MSIEDIVMKVKSLELNRNIPNFIEQINYQCAESMPYEDYKMLDMQIKKAELLFKTYALACARDDKDLRIETMKVFKELLPTLPDCLIKYRKHVKDCLKDSEKKKKSDKKEPECSHK